MQNGVLGVFRWLVVRGDGYCFLPDAVIDPGHRLREGGGIDSHDAAWPCLSLSAGDSDAGVVEYPEEARWVWMHPNV